MANTFTTTYRRRFGGSNDQDLVFVQGTLVIDTTATGGAVAGDLPASLFGLTGIREGGQAVISDNSKNYFTSPAYDGGSLLVGGGALNVPMDLPNGTYVLTLKGY